jgi:hypothetical protein
LRLLQDFQAHREQALFDRLSAEARAWALNAAR